MLILKPFMSKVLLKKEIVKLLLILIFITGCSTGTVVAQQTNNGLSATDVAPVPKAIEDSEKIGITKEASHATLIPCGSMKEALAANRYASSLSKNLNGICLKVKERL